MWDDNFYTYDFSKNGNEIIVHGQGQHISTIELNSEEYPIKESRLGDNGFHPNHTWQYLNGNLASICGIGANYDKQSFRYDNKKSPFYYCKTPKWLLIWYGAGGLYSDIKNNRIETIDRERVDGNIYEYITEYTYEYDSNGFPIKMNSSIGEFYTLFTY
jgi:hypothetical protein